MATLTPAETGASLEETMVPGTAWGTRVWQLTSQDTLSLEGSEFMEPDGSPGSSSSSEQHSWEASQELRAETIAPCGGLDGGLISVLRRLGETDLSSSDGFEESLQGHDAWQETLRQLRSRYTQHLDLEETWTPAGGLDGGLADVLRRLGEQDLGGTFSATGAANVRRLWQLSTVLLGEKLSAE